MPQSKPIIFLKDKAGHFKLRSDIKSFGYEEHLGQYYVLFKKGDNYLHYKPANVDVATFARQLEPPFRITRNSNGEVLYKILGILMHYPLRHLITAASNLTPEQRTYASRSWTHIDFLIYDCVTHKAKLAIEVDGTQYHKADSDQGLRDIMKDSVLATINLPLLRLSTAGSHEKEKIASALTRNNP